MFLVIKENCQECYEHILFYADNILLSLYQAQHVIRNQIGKYFETKKESAGPPTRHLGRSMRKVLLDHVAEAWAFSSSQNSRASNYNVESCLKKKGLPFPKSCDSPLLTS